MASDLAEAPFVGETGGDGVTDQDAAKKLLFRLALSHPEIATIWADSAYAGKLVDWAKKYLDITIKTGRRPPDAKGFVVLPRRWVG